MACLCVQHPGVVRKASCVRRGAAPGWAAWWRCPKSLRCGSAETAASRRHPDLSCPTWCCRCPSAWENIPDISNRKCWLPRVRSAPHGTHLYVFPLGPGKTMAKLKWVPFFLASGYTSLTKPVSSFRVASILQHTQPWVSLRRTRRPTKTSSSRPHHVYIWSSLDGTLPRANSSNLWCRPLLVVKTRSSRGQVCSKEGGEDETF